MALDANLIEDFEAKTRYDLKKYLLGFEYFSDNHYYKVLDFYGGESKVIPSQSLVLLDVLIVQSKKIDNLINVKRNRFDTTDYWDLLEILEDIKGKLITIKNTPKWSRTSRSNAIIVNNPEVTIQLKQNQTIERLAGGSLGFDDEHNDWYDIAIRNDLEEEDYTPKGGNRLSVYATGGVSFDIESIVDVIDSETMKGKEVYRKITWENGDLKVLSGDDSFIQSMEILASLSKGDNPEYVSNGITNNLAIGQNINSVAYPLLVRHINEVFSSDDSISSFKILDVSKRQDGIFINMEITSKSTEIYSITTIL
jgi:hypothetical protein